MEKLLKKKFEAIIYEHMMYYMYIDMHIILHHSR